MNRMLTSKALHALAVLLLLLGNSFGGVLRVAFASEGTSAASCSRSGGACCCKNKAAKHGTSNWSSVSVCPAQGKCQSSQPPQAAHLLLTSKGALTSTPLFIAALLTPSSPAIGAHAERSSWQQRPPPLFVR